MRQGLRNGLLVFGLAIGSVSSAPAQVSVGIGLPGVSIGINLPVYPELVPVPGYPVYYAPRVSSNYFFYDGMYWVYQSDNWYASSWYNGPWGHVAPEVVPLYVLRVPVRITVARRRIFTGRPTCRALKHTGAMNGSNVEYGTTGIVVRHRPVRRCQRIRSRIPGIDIRTRSSSPYFKARSTSTTVTL
jgi:hypothetical protein